MNALGLSSAFAHDFQSRVKLCLLLHLQRELRTVPNDMTFDSNRFSGDLSDGSGGAAGRTPPTPLNLVFGKFIQLIASQKDLESNRTAIALLIASLEELSDVPLSALKNEAPQTLDRLEGLLSSILTDSSTGSGSGGSDSKSPPPLYDERGLLAILINLALTRGSAGRLIMLVNTLLTLHNKSAANKRTALALMPGGLDGLKKLTAPTDLHPPIPSFMAAEATVKGWTASEFGCSVSDGKFLYVHSKGNGLQKLRLAAAAGSTGSTGSSGSGMGEVVASNPEFYPNVRDSSMAYVGGRLFFRSTAIAPAALIVIDRQTLRSSGTINPAGNGSIATANNSSQKPFDARSGGSIIAYQQKQLGLLSLGPSGYKLHVFSGSDLAFQRSIFIPTDVSDADSSRSAGAGASAYISGANDYGQYGNATSSRSNTPYKLSFFEDKLSPIKHVAIGSNFAIVLLHNGDVYSAGYNPYGQLATGDQTNKSIWTEVKSLKSKGSPVAQISAGDQHSLYLLENGEVYACGYNY